MRNKLDVMHRPQILEILNDASAIYTLFCHLTPLHLLAFHGHQAWTYLSDSQVCWQLPMTPEAVDLDLTGSYTELY